jgi:hypothetical protein
MQLSEIALNLDDGSDPLGRPGLRRPLEDRVGCTMARHGEIV